MKKRVITDAGRLAGNADAFFNATGVLLGDPGSRVPLPGLVLGWFTCELLLKLCALVERGGYLPTHALTTLFNDLPNGTQDAVVEKFQAIMALSTFEEAERSWRKMLEDANRDFIDARYIAEVRTDASERLFTDPLPFLFSIAQVLGPMLQAQGITTANIQLDRIS